MQIYRNEKGKECSKCKIFYEWEDYPKHRGMKDGYDSRCKKCNRASCKSYKRINKDKIREYNEVYREENKENIAKQCKIYHATTRAKELRKISRNKRRRENPQVNISHRMEVGIRSALRDNKNGRKWEDLVGYTKEDLAKHLKSLFTEGMTWKRFLAGDIHIDHIIPQSAFTYTDVEDEDFLQCWSLENLQPLWHYDNMNKGCGHS